MLCSMAIRMKEWGMQAYPRQGVHLPLNALNDWGRSGRVLGQGVAEAGSGAAELADAIYRVQKTGNVADMASALEQIGRETTDELLELPVRDWDYSWQQAYEPRVQEMLSQYSGEEREQARKLSEVYGRRYSLDGRRRLEVERIRQSRRNWQQQVDSAVQQGDSQSARDWLEQGSGVFLPEEQLPQQLDQAQSRSLHARWQQRLLQEPCAALAAWNDEQEERPADAEELRALTQEVEQTRRLVLGSLAAGLAAGVAQGKEPAAAELEQAVVAGVLSREQVEEWQSEPRRPAAGAVCDWQRRIDERSGEDDERLIVDVSLAPLPVGQRRALLARLQATKSLPEQQRVGTSRCLWNMYRQGYFGCPGDAETLQALERLQKEALERQCAGTEKDCTRWLAQLRSETENWVCYEA